GAGLEQRGGGRVLVSAGGDIKGGEYLVSNNRGILAAGGSIGAQTATAIYLIGASDSAARANASAELRAGGDIHLQNVSNPTILPLPFPRPASISDTSYATLTELGITSNTDGFGTFTRASFFSYGADDSISLLSVAGNIDLNNRLRL